MLLFPVYILLYSLHIINLFAHYAYFSFFSMLALLFHSLHICTPHTLYYNKTNICCTYVIALFKIRVILGVLVQFVCDCFISCYNCAGENVNKIWLKQPSHLLDFQILVWQFLCNSRTQMMQKKYILFQENDNIINTMSFIL